MQKTPDPDFDRLYEAADVPTKDLIDDAIAHGLAYRGWPNELYELLVDKHLPLDLLTDEIERQLSNMPSVALH